MKINSLSIVPAAMLLALGLIAQDASAQNFPGQQAHASVPSEASCFSTSRSAIYNNGCDGYAHNVVMPLMGENGGTQSLTANISAASVGDVSCTWESDDPTNAYWYTSGTYNTVTGTTSLTLSNTIYDPGSSFLDCSLASGAKLISVVWTM